MKKFNLVYVMGLSTILFHAQMHTVDTVITFFIKNDQTQDTESIDQNVTEVVSGKLTQPSYIMKHNSNPVSSELDGVRGIPAVYLGYLATSNKNGQVSFPRKQQSDTIHLLITPKIQPIFMLHPTLIHHWQIDSSQPVEMYEINRKKDKKLNTYYFDTINIKQAIQTKTFDDAKSETYKSILAGKQAIPLNTVTIFSDPTSMNVPTGVTYNYYSPNFILPTLSAKEVDRTENSLYTLSIKQYFEQVGILSKSDGANLATILANQ